MTDFAVGRIIAVLVGVVGVYDDTGYGALAVRRKDAAGNHQGITGFVGRNNRRFPSCVRRFGRGRVLGSTR
jgi:hypothetical protein